MQFRTFLVSSYGDDLKEYSTRVRFSDEELYELTGSMDGTPTVEQILDRCPSGYQEYATIWEWFGTFEKIKVTK